MATNTPRINLVKPDGTDLVDIAVINSNYDKIDANIASTKIQATKPSTANAGDLWWDSNTGTLYLYYTDANSSQWVAATSDPVNIGVVANQTERDTQYPTPGQGMSVYRTDLGARETYYGLYNVSTNPGGRDPAGWYQGEKGNVIGFVRNMVNANILTTSSSYVDAATFTVDYTPKQSNSLLRITADFNHLSYLAGGQNVGGTWAITDSSNNVLKEAAWGYYDGGSAERNVTGRAIITVFVAATNTSTRTYKLRYKTFATRSQIGADGTLSTFTVEEISQ